MWLLVLVQDTSSLNILDEIKRFIFYYKIQWLSKWEKFIPANGTYSFSMKIIGERDTKKSE